MASVRIIAGTAGKCATLAAARVCGERGRERARREARAACRPSRSGTRQEPMPYEWVSGIAASVTSPGPNAHRAHDLHGVGGELAGAHGDGARQAGRARGQLEHGGGLPARRPAPASGRAATATDRGRPGRCPRPAEPLGRGHERTRRPRRPRRARSSSAGAAASTSATRAGEQPERGEGAHEVGRRWAARARPWTPGGRGARLARAGPRSRPASAARVAIISPSGPSSAGGPPASAGEGEEAADDRAGRLRHSPPRMRASIASTVACARCS